MILAGVRQRVEARELAVRAVLVVAGRRDLRITHAVADDQDDVAGVIVVLASESGGGHRDSGGGENRQEYATMTTAREPASGAAAGTIGDDAGPVPRERVLADAWRGATNSPRVVDLTQRPSACTLNLTNAARGARSVQSKSSRSSISSRV